MAQAKLASQMLGVLPPDAVIINATKTRWVPARRPARRSPRSCPWAAATTAWGELDAPHQGIRAMQLGLKPENNRLLRRLLGASALTPTLAFTGPGKGLVMADPSLRVRQHGRPDLQGLSQEDPADLDLLPRRQEDGSPADPNAGLIYIVNPNNPHRNPSTPREEILWALEKQAQGLDPAGGRGVHPSVRRTPTCWTRWRPVRTSSSCARSPRSTAWLAFRCGVAIARPDLLDKLTAPTTRTPCRSTAPGRRARLAAADKELIPTRKKVDR